MTGIQDLVCLDVGTKGRGLCAKGKVAKSSDVIAIELELRVIQEGRVLSLYWLPQILHEG